MNKFTSHNGAAVQVEFAQCSDITLRAYGVQVCTVEFQCLETCGVPGLVYVQFTPKGKRKTRSIAVHQDSVTLI